MSSWAWFLPGRAVGQWGEGSAFFREGGNQAFVLECRRDQGGGREVLKVFYDISNLGYGAVRTVYRTGVFRATQRLGQALVDHYPAEIAFCAADSPRAWALAHRHWKHQGWEKIPFVPAPPFGSPYVSAQNWLTALNAVAQAPWPVRILRRGLREVVNRIEPSILLFPKAGPGSVYHSTFFPLPPSTPGVQRVLSIYDIINLTHPEMTIDGGGLLPKIVASIQPGDWTVCCSEWTRQDLLAYRPDLDPDRVVAVHLGVDEFFRPASAEQVAQVRRKYKVGDQPYFLGVSTTEKRKNFPFLVKAFRQFLEKRPDCDAHLVLVGAVGTAAEEIGRSVPSHLRGRIHVTGFIDDTDLPSLYTGAIGFVFPSLFEGFGFPPLEAMACGTPVLAGAGSSLTEVVGDAAPLLDPTDAEAWVHGLECLYDSPSDRQRWIEKGRAWSARFTWKNCAAEHMALYRKATEGK